MKVKVEGERSGGMEADEIRVVLARASELHAKISEAIERALKTEFRRSTSSRSLDSSFSSVVDGDESNDFGNFDRDSNKAGSVGGDGNAEARTLGLIRDALETLEEQLEALQVLCSIIIHFFSFRSGVLSRSSLRGLRESSLDELDTR